MNKTKTLFNAMYNIAEQVDGIAISYGSIGDINNPACWVTFNEGSIKVYETKEQARNNYRLILTSIMENMNTNPNDTELPW